MSILHWDNFISKLDGKLIMYLSDILKYHKVASYYFTCRCCPDKNNAKELAIIHNVNLRKATVLYDGHAAAVLIPLTEKELIHIVNRTLKLKAFT